jgi:hypothetical protein
MLCCDLCCVLHAAAAQPGKDSSYFLANDPKLLEIMEQQGLQFAVHIIPAAKDGRLGYAHSMGDFLGRMMVKSGNVNEACGESTPSHPPRTAAAARAGVRLCSPTWLLLLMHVHGGVLSNM